MNETIEVTTIDVTGPRAEFEMAHPEAKRLRQDAQAKIGEMIGNLRERIAPVVVEFFKAEKQELWQIGKQIEAFVDTLPGKELTPDFYNQMRHGFIDNHGQTIGYSMLMMLLKLARKYPDGQISSFSLQEYWKQLPMYLGGDALQSDSDKPADKEKKPTDNPYFWFQKLTDRCVSDAQALRLKLDEFRSVPKFGDFSTLKEREPQLHYELKQHFQLALKSRQDECETLREAVTELGQ